MSGARGQGSGKVSAPPTDYKTHITASDYSQFPFPYSLKLNTHNKGNEKMKHFLDSFQNNSCYLFVSLFKISFTVLLNCCFSDICGEECKTAYLFIQNSGGFGGKTHASNSGQLLYCCLYIIASHSRPIRMAPQANSFACARNNARKSELQALLWHQTYWLSCGYR